MRIMTLLHYAPDAQVAALCLIQVFLIAAAVGCAAAVAAVLVRLDARLLRWVR